MIDHNHFICHFIFGGHLLNIPILKPSRQFFDAFKDWHRMCRNLASEGK